MTDAVVAGLSLDLSLVGLADARRCGGAVARRPAAHASASTASHDDRSLVVVTTAHSSPQLQQWIEFLLEARRCPRVERIEVDEQVFEDLLRQAEAGLSALTDLVAPERTTPAAQDQTLSISFSTIETSESAVVRLVDSTLYDALKAGASDIHFELQGDGLVVRYRLDGVLQTATQVQGLEMALQAVSRIKVLADLDISERRIPQDGRFRVRFDAREVDFRVSIMPNLQGEDAVLRILDRKHLTGDQHTLTLDVLGFDEAVKAFVRKCAALPHGMLLVTGPTGSGKTTTLYGAISEIHTGLDKIVTIEDPIEYQLAGVLQIPVNEKKGLSFATGLRSILRHDPDKIMVGEIRDRETAQIAVQAALTGHQVFTTVHANNVFDVLGRFTNMAVDSYSLVAALNGIMAQRLVRCLCRHCAAPSRQGGEPAERAGSEDLASLGSLASLAGQEVLAAVGCERCRGTGYKGRVAVAETLVIDDAIKDLMLAHRSVVELKQAASARGLRTIREAALGLVARGVTSLDEVNRVAAAL